MRASPLSAAENSGTLSRVDPVAEIKKLYYGATRATIKQDVDRAIDLLKALPNDEERERAAVYMDGEGIRDRMIAEELEKLRKSRLS